VESPSNPNYTRSYGHSIEPQTHTGLLISYRITEAISLSGGIANTMNSAINSRAHAGSTGTPSGVFATLFPGLTLADTGDNQYAESYKTYMGSIALTAPESMGFLAGSTLYGGVENGYNNSVLGTGVGLQQLNAYAGVTLATPVTGLRVGAAFDLMDIDTRNVHGSGPISGAFIDGEIWTLAGYLSYQVTEKLSVHARGEYVDAMLDEPLSGHQHLFALTTTAQYDLWKNVTTRVELRWDHSTSGNKIFGGDTSEDAPDRKNAWMLAANVIYKF
jgi:hypothetical protein